MKPTNEQKAKAWELAAMLIERDIDDDNDDGEGKPVDADTRVVRAHAALVVAPFLRKKASDIRAKPPQFQR